MGSTGRVTETLNGPSAPWGSCTPDSGWAAAEQDWARGRQCPVCPCVSVRGVSRVCLVRSRETVLRDTCALKVGALVGACAWCLNHCVESEHQSA